MKKKEQFKIQSKSYKKTMGIFSMKKLFLQNSFYNYYEINYNFNECPINQFTNIQSNIYFFLCFFKNFYSQSSNGGCVSIISSSSINFLTESCLFDYCRTNYYGGAIYLSLSGGSSIITKTCGFECFLCGSGYQYGLFIFISTINKNFLLYSSISKCAPDHNFLTIRSISIEGGNQSILNTNSSNNKSNQRSGLFTSGSQNSLISFCTFKDNDSLNYIIIDFESSHNSRILQNSNIINNNSPSYGIITIYDSTILLNNCNFLNNYNNLFYIYSNGYLTVSNCYLLHLNSISNGNMILINTQNELILLNLNYLNSCLINESLLLLKSNLKKINNYKFYFIIFNYLVVE